MCLLPVLGVHRVGMVLTLVGEAVFSEVSLNTILKTC